MKNLFFLAVVLLGIACRDTKMGNSEVSLETSKYLYTIDSTEIEKWEADQYGMKPYIMAFLKKGPNRDRTPEESAELQKAHLENIGRLAQEGKLVLAGPFLDDQDIRGIYIFDVKTIEEAQALTETDPAIEAGSLVMELHPWYGSAALLAISDLHALVQDSSITN